MGEFLKVPYIDPTIFFGSGFPFREGDIVISVPVKCGTNWTMFLVYSILTGGDVEFDDLYERVPWLEFKWCPDQSVEDRIRLLEAINYNTPGHRTFKTHIPLLPGLLPFTDTVKYIFTCRNPFDMVLSMAPFFSNHRDEFFELWGLEDMKSKFKHVDSVIEMLEKGMFPPLLFESYHAAWQLRDRPNVLLVHFTDLKRDLRKEILRVAKFLGRDLLPDEFDRVAKHCDFRWMKEHENKFNVTAIGFRKPDGTLEQLLKPSTMLRKGEVGEHESELSDIQRDRIFKVAKDKVGKDKELLQWIFDGTL